MKNFLTQLIIFTIFILIILGLLGRKYNFNNSAPDYMEAIIDKHSAVKKASTPKLIFCGGSNLAFGIDSHKIQDSIGLPVINLGLHASLGLAFILNEIKDLAKKNDIIIFSLEYYISMDGDFNLQKHTAQFFPYSYKYFSKSYFSILKSILVEELPKNLRSNIENLTQSDNINYDTTIVYSRDAFNQHGDVTKHLNKPIPEKFNYYSNYKYAYWEGIKYLNEFAIYAKDNGINIYFLYPAFPQSEYIKNKKVIQLFSKDIENDLNVIVLNQYFGNF